MENTLVDIKDISVSYHTDNNCIRYLDMSI